MKAPLVIASEAKQSSAREARKQKDAVFVASSDWIASALRAAQ
jgi:hypothetical protein